MAKLPGKNHDLASFVAKFELIKNSRMVVDFNLE